MQNIETLKKGTGFIPLAQPLMIDGFHVIGILSGTSATLVVTEKGTEKLISPLRLPRRVAQDVLGLR